MFNTFISLTRWTIIWQKIIILDKLGGYSEVKLKFIPIMHREPKLLK